MAKPFLTRCDLGGVRWPTLAPACQIPDRNKREPFMKDQFPRTLPRTTMKEWAWLLSAFPLLLGMVLTFYNAVMVFRKTGVTGWDFYPRDAPHVGGARFGNHLAS